MACGKGMTWDAASDRKLLLGIVTTSNITVDNDAMAKYMSTTEVECTAEAIKSRIKKLRAMVKNGDGGETASPALSTKPTPTKRKAAGIGGDKQTPSKKAKTSKDTGGNGTLTPVEDEDDEEGIAVKGGLKEEDGESD